MMGILIKTDNGWHCYKGNRDSRNWLCCVSTKKAAMDIGKKYGCVSFRIEAQ